MKMTAGAVHDAVLALTEIINKPRKIPQIAKYRIARLHATLEKEYQLIEAERVKLVQELGEEVFQDPPANTKSMGWQVPRGTPKFDEYAKRWTEMREQQLEVNVQPVPLGSLGDSPEGVEAAEFRLMGDLIEESK